MIIRYALLCTIVSFSAYGMFEEIDEAQAHNTFLPSPKVVRLKFSDVYPGRWFSRDDTLEQRVIFTSFSQAVAYKDYVKAYVCYRELIKSCSPESLRVREAQCSWKCFMCPSAKPPLPPYENIPLDQETEEEKEDQGI